MLLHCLHPTKSIDLVIRRLYSSLLGLWPLPYYVIFYKKSISLVHNVTDNYPTKLLTGISDIHTEFDFS